MTEPPPTETPPEAAPSAPESLGKRAYRGTLLSLANVGGVQILRLGGNLIVTRLLFPEAYGLMLLVLILNQGLRMVSDIGIVPSIIQHERGDERAFLDTAWTLQLIRGGLLSLLGAAIAYPYAVFYGQPDLFQLVLFAATQGFISGLDSTKVATLNRRIQLGRLVFINLASQVVTLVVMVVWAVLAPSVWALIGGAVAGDAFRTMLSWVAIPGRNNRFAWDRDAASVIFDFGKWIFLSTLVTYAGMRFDSMALGKLVSLTELGVYNIGQNLAGLPTLLTGQIVMWVLLPALSESFREEPTEFAERVRGARKVLNAAGVLMIAATCIGSPPFFYLLYDERYHDAGWMVQLLMVPTWFFFLQETSIRVQLAMGDSRSQMTSNVFKLIGTVPGALGGYAIGGLPGLVLGLTLGSLCGYSAVAWGLRQKGIPIFISDLKWTALALVLCLVGGVTPWLLAPVLSVDAPLLSLAIGPVVGLPYLFWTVKRVQRARREARA